MHSDGIKRPAWAWGAWNYLNVQLRRRWLDAAITQSPLVSTKLQGSGFLALTRSFK